MKSAPRLHKALSNFKDTHVILVLELNDCLVWLLPVLVLITELMTRYRVRGVVCGLRVVCKHDLHRQLPGFSLPLNVLT